MSQARECGEKKPHKTKENAMRHRAALIRKGAFPGRLWTYECSRCGFWHVGHTKRRRRANA